MINKSKIVKLPASLCITASVALFVLLVACGQPTSDIENVQRAHQELKKGDHRAAVIFLKNALVSNPDNLEARITLADVYLSLGDGASAEKELLRAIDLGIPLQAVQLQLVTSWFQQQKDDAVLGEQISGDLHESVRAEILSMQGEVLLQRGEIAAAEDKYNQAAALFPASAAPWVGHALVAFVKQDLDRAHQLASKVLEIDESSGAAWGMMGDIARLRGDLEDAAKHYGKALKTTMNPMAVLENRVLVLSQLQRFDEARKDIARMRELNANHPAVQYATGFLALSERRHRDSMTSFQAVLSKTARYKDAAIYLGMINLEAGNFQQADTLLSREFLEKPTSIRVRIMLAMARLQNNQAKDAEQLLSPVVEQFPENVQARSLLASALLIQGRSDEALMHLKTIAELNPEQQWLQEQLGMGMLLHGDYEQGARLLESIISKGPFLGQSGALLVVAHLERGEFDKAMEAAKRFQEQYPATPHPVTLQGLAYLGLNDKQAARVAFEQAIALAPGDPAANYQLALLDMEDNDLPGARARYEQILAVHPDHAQTLQRLARLEARAGDEKALVDALNAAIEASPGSIQFYIQLGRYHLLKGHPQRTLSVLSPMRQEHGGNAELLQLSGEAYMALESWTIARNEFSSLAKIESHEAQGHYSLARLCARLGDQACLKQQVAKALEVDPRHMASRIEWVRVLTQESRFAEAGRLLDGIKNDLGDDHPFVYALGNSLAVAQGQRERALSIQERAMERYPDTAMVIELVKGLWENRSFDDAMLLLERRSADNPLDIKLLLVKANYHLELNQKQEAELLYRKVLDLAPDQVLALNNLAQLLGEKDPGEAARLARRALSVSADNPVVIDTLVTALLNDAKTAEAQRLVDGFMIRSNHGPDARYLHALLLKHNGQLSAARSELSDLLGGEQFALMKQARQTLLELNQQGKQTQ